MGPATAYGEEPWPANRLEREPRHAHSPRVTVPEPQLPDPSSPSTRDALFPFLEWEHLTDDWGGLRPWLDDQGVVIDPSLTLDVSRNLRGGVSTRQTIARYLFDLNITVNAERRWGWTGATLFVDLQSFDGRTGEEIVGDYQIFSNIDAVPVTQVPQMWIEQQWREGAVRLKVGMVDANSEFAFTEHGAEFLNSSMGFSPTIFVMPTYPDPATSINLFWKPADWLQLGGGVYDGAGQRGVPTGSRGPRTLLNEKLFVIGEAVLNLEPWAGRPGRAAAGVWRHTGDFDAFDGSRKTGTGGWYALLDQQLWAESPGDTDDSQGLALFVQTGAADPRVSEVTRHVGGGLAWQGLLPGRDDDVLGVGISWVRFSRQAGFAAPGETATELFYKTAVTPWAAWTLDLQHIRAPGGQPGRRDALVATSRLILRF